MRLTAVLALFILGTSGLTSQSILTEHDPAQTLSPQQCMDLIKTAWDSLKAISDNSRSLATEKSEFESSAEYNERLRKLNDEFIERIRAFYSGNKFNTKVYSVWLKAELVRSLK
ncbi:MAG: hypothetical protein HUU02_05210, partial [Bacteroidetes bacterium]|nr:hypothetical protein [Bacteroidota bacterium]